MIAVFYVYSFFLNYIYNNDNILGTKLPYLQLSVEFLRWMQKYVLVSSYNLNKSSVQCKLSQVQTHSDSLSLLAPLRGAKRIRWSLSGRHVPFEGAGPWTFRAPHLLRDALRPNPAHSSQRLVAVKSQHYVNHMAGTVTSVVPLQSFLSLTLSSKMERKGKSNWICCWKGNDEMT